MKSARLIAFALTFFLDVQVRAADHSAHHDKHEKKHDETCWGHQIPCAVQASDHRQTVSAQKFKMIMAPSSLANQSDATTVSLVKGEFYLDVAMPSKFKTPYGEFSCATACKGLVQRGEDEFTLKNLGGTWVFRRTGDKAEYSLESGLQVTIGEVTDKGVARMEVPQSLPWNLTVKQWARLFDGPVADFKKELTRFRSEWNTAVENSAQVQQGVAARAIASHERELEAARRRQQALEREEAELRKLFRAKNNFDN